MKASVLGTIDALDRLIALTAPPTKVVPGHGPVVGERRSCFIATWPTKFSTARH